MTSKADAERVAESFVRMMRKEGLAHTLQYLKAIEDGKIPMPPRVPMSKQEFIECGRAGCIAYVNKHPNPKMN